ncbi:hypothetical protein EPA93_08080 [Ktedonosporobacter rubrisoli]|uniref:DUF885 domain-containing protein n=1 Tax=Ktedonosporobacter rubrisoli TaxID=2509675 RepID=A0A4P6JLA5_KTERU|nr:hypothetical protein [Ktedonosporobacter rubrisoli]QBD75965.1 hypothetical protein EPA93_08080 [Ktedonosporobacter rubrisoli]
MNEQWLRDYTVLCLRLNKHIHAQTGYIDVEEYQPPEWYEQVQHEPLQPHELLLHDTQKLMDSLPQQNFLAQRSIFLARQLRALETVARRLQGERFSLKEEVARCFDLQVDWVPESVFEQAYALYDEALPGSGSLAERFKSWKAAFTLPAAKKHLLPMFLQRALDEARKRTRALVPFPADEQAEIKTITDQPVRAIACYLGNKRSCIYLNPAVPFPLTDLFYVLCHEGYPGHLAEAVLKDEELIKKRGYLEQRVGLLYTPPFVISEGLALLAHELLFAPGEAEQWLAEHIYPEAGLQPDGSDLTKIQRATDLLFGVSCNAAWLLREGRPADEVRDYLQRYALLNDEAAHRQLASLQRPFHQTYIYTYFYGRRLLEASLQGAQRQERMWQLLTEQLTASDISKW